MTHPVDDESARRSRLPVVLRSFGMTAAIGLGAFAVWLIVTAETQKGTRVGALIGFWALLLAAYSVLGTRNSAPVAVVAAPDSSGRAGSELARVEDAAARREYEYRLMEMLRREITATMSSELVTLRADVASLRSELVEKVGGQIRLERIETTRVIGSDIEALQHEVRQMMGGRQSDRLDSFSLGRAHSALMAPLEPPASEPLRLEPFASEPPSRPEPFRPVPGPFVPPVPAEPPVPPAPKPFSPEPPAPRPVEPEPLSPEPIAPEPITPEPIMPEPISPEPVPPPQAERPAPPAALPWTAEPSPNGDPFASMPRLRPFTDFELDPVDSRPVSPVAAPGPVSSLSSPVNGSAAPAGPNAGRHTNANGDANGAGAAETGGGRRRRAADADDDVLARILSREGTR